MIRTAHIWVYPWLPICSCMVVSQHCIPYFLSNCIICDSSWAAISYRTARSSVEIGLPSVLHVRRFRTALGRQRPAKPKGRVRTNRWRWWMTSRSSYALLIRSALWTWKSNDGFDDNTIIMRYDTDKTVNTAIERGEIARRLSEWRDLSNYKDMLIITQSTLRTTIANKDLRTGSSPQP